MCVRRLGIIVSYFRLHKNGFGKVANDIVAVRLPHCTDYFIINNFTVNKQINAIFRILNDCTALHCLKYINRKLKGIVSIRLS